MGHRHHHHHGEGGGHEHGHEHEQGQGQGTVGGGPRDVDLELSKMLSSRAKEMTRDVVLEVLRDAIKEEVRKLPELQTIAAQAARELAENLRLSLQIEELIAQRDDKQEESRAELLATLLGKDKAGG